ncbi:MerR family transcriptional regulator [Yinghuangia sp. ASG 101]|uniref:MerR family transcriptional regulator n=1 Tax=Yinghuangia sp. ASG 101 TaxID=2896848 RepID=UPI001E5FB680|nr:MerR family transcriptional regulator [Yinghuangia sp. ASG 101]UGQ14089.1 MerR family transcriptional regulator [Yinghuangia sp. ASG 101]
MSLTEAAPPAAAEIGRYTISEVAARTGLSAHTLRWYERIGLMPHVGREAPRSGNGRAGRRRYSERDLGFLDFVGKLRATGMPVADMIRYAELAREGDATHAERHRMLVAHREEVRARISDLTSCLLVLDYKIDFYGACTVAGRTEGEVTE